MLEVTQEELEKLRQAPVALFEMSTLPNGTERISSLPPGVG